MEDDMELTTTEMIKVLVTLLMVAAGAICLGAAVLLR